MGSINLDASEIKKHKLIQEKAEMVEMHNGCICCTLRGDLLKTVKALAEEDKYDYLVIESTGVSVTVCCLWWMFDMCSYSHYAVRHSTDLGTVARGADICYGC